MQKPQGRTVPEDQEDRQELESIVEWGAGVREVGTRSHRHCWHHRRAEITRSEAELAGPVVEGSFGPLEDGLKGQNRRAWRQ